MPDNSELTISAIFEMAREKGMEPRLWTWKPLQTYNGFHHDLRVKKWQAIYLGVQLGLVLPADDFPCDICGSLTSRTAVAYHSEDYSSMNDHYPLCKDCHSHVHLRFRSPNSWFDFIREYGDGTKWFEQLQIDPMGQDGKPIPRRSS